MSPAHKELEAVNKYTHAMVLLELSPPPLQQHPDFS